MRRDITIRPADRADVPAITDLYNLYIVDSHVSFDDEPWTVDQRLAWFADYGPTGRLRCVVADDAEAGVLGTAYSSDFRKKTGYRTSVQSTVVLHPDATGRGLGTRLMQKLLDELRTEDLHRVFAIVALPNDASIALHEKLGYKAVGIEHESGFKMGSYWSTQVFELRLD